jgi:hypothetical protein
MLVSSSTSKIYALGEFTSDVLYDTGATPFPFAPITGALIPWGIGAPFSAVDYRGRIMWLAQNKDGDRKVVSLAGYSTATVISNEALETALGTYETVNDAEGFVYDDTGESAYVLNFPSANATWVFTDDGGWRKQQMEHRQPQLRRVARAQSRARLRQAPGRRSLHRHDLRAEFVVRVRLRRRAAAARAADAGPVGAGSSASSTRACGSTSTTASGS